MVIIFSLFYAGFAVWLTADTQWAVDFWPVAWAVLAVGKAVEWWATQHAVRKVAT